MRVSKRGRRRHSSEELRGRISKMWDAGATQSEIVDALQVPDADVQYHLQKAGVPATRQHKGHPVVRGKRVCVQCKKHKELKLYPTPRQATCLACRQKTTADTHS